MSKPKSDCDCKNCQIKLPHYQCLECSLFQTCPFYHGCHDFVPKSCDNCLGCDLDKIGKDACISFNNLYWKIKEDKNGKEQKIPMKYEQYYCPCCGTLIKTVNGKVRQIQFRGYKYEGPVCNNCIKNRED